MSKNRAYKIDKNKYQHYSIAETRANFTDIANRVSYGNERVIVDRYHNSVMALISIDDLALLEEIENQQDIKLARQRLKTIKTHGKTSLADLEKELASQ